MDGSLHDAGREVVGEGEALRPERDGPVRGRGGDQRTDALDLPRELHGNRGVTACRDALAVLADACMFDVPEIVIGHDPHRRVVAPQARRDGRVGRHGLALEVDPHPANAEIEMPGERTHGQLPQRARVIPTPPDLGRRDDVGGGTRDSEEYTRDWRGAAPGHETACRRRRASPRDTYSQRRLPTRSGTKLKPRACNS